MRDFQAAILAGGKSSRMGTDKALLQIDGQTVIEKILEKTNKLCKKTIVIANDTKKYSFLPVAIFCDRYKNKGPLAGLESALHYSHSDYILVSACDTPFISEEVYLHLMDQIKNEEELQAVIPKYNGRLHPLSGIYHSSTLTYIQKCIEEDRLKMTSFLDDIHFKMIDHFPNVPKNKLENHFFNMNYPDEYEYAKNL